MQTRPLQFWCKTSSSFVADSPTLSGEYSALQTILLSGKYGEEHEISNYHSLDVLSESQNVHGVRMQLCRERWTASNALQATAIVV